MMKLKENFDKLKKLCLEEKEAYEKNSDLLHKYYSENTGNFYEDFLKESEEGRKSSVALKLARENLNKTIYIGCSDYGDECCLDRVGILKVLKLLEGEKIK